jgi:regulator of CtrA degradation
MVDQEAIKSVIVTDAIAFGRQFATSDAFKSLFREGMTLVEEAAAYLDGPGRDQSRALQRLSALTYANESMRLTTRLMQLASWLLVQRAVAEGEMSTIDASAQLGNMRIHRNEPPLSAAHIETLPETLVTLIQQSLRLQNRVQHLDGIINKTSTNVESLKGRNAVALQHMLLTSAFTRTNPVA